MIDSRLEAEVRSENSKIQTHGSPPHHHSLSSSSRSPHRYDLSFINLHHNYNQSLPLPIYLHLVSQRPCASSSHYPSSLHKHTHTQTHKQTNKDLVYPPTCSRSTRFGIDQDISSLRLRLQTTTAQRIPPTSTTTSGQTPHPHSPPPPSLRLTSSTLDNHVASHHPRRAHQRPHPLYLGRPYRLGIRIAKASTGHHPRDFPGRREQWSIRANDVQPVSSRDPPRLQERGGGVCFDRTGWAGWLIVSSSCVHVTSSVSVSSGVGDKVYIIDKTENNPLQVNSDTGRQHPAWAVSYDTVTNEVRAMDVESNPFCAGGMSLGNGSWAVFGGNQPITTGKSKSGSGHHPPCRRSCRTES